MPHEHHHPMPTELFFSLTARHRQRRANVALGGVLAFVAGATMLAAFWPCIATPRT